MRHGKRLRLLGLAGQFRFAIVEDDYDHEFHFSHQPLLPLASVAPRKTIYVGSMSKLLTPSIRLGYVVAPALVIERMAGEVLLLDRQGDPATELAIAGLIDSGEVNRHARKSLQIYAHRRQLFSLLLRESIGDILPFEEPEGGLAFWMDIDGRLDIEKLNERASREGIQYLPPNSFAASPNSTNRGCGLDSPASRTRNLLKRRAGWRSRCDTPRGQEEKDTPSKPGDPTRFGVTVRAFAEEWRSSGRSDRTAGP
jgi:GntR family transcriptional regulator / MocR family aminotransferase